MTVRRTTVTWQIYWHFYLQILRRDFFFFFFTAGHPLFFSLLSKLKKAEEAFSWQQNGNTRRTSLGVRLCLSLSSNVLHYLLLTSPTSTVHSQFDWESQQDPRFQLPHVCWMLLPSSNPLCWPPFLISIECETTNFRRATNQQWNETLMVGEMNSAGWHNRGGNTGVPKLPR